jgi:hypothetical protein
MKHPTLKLVLVLFLLILSIQGFSSKRCIAKQLDTINTILIQFYPWFGVPTQILVDIPKSELTFYRFGSKEIYYPPSEPADSLKSNYNPNVLIQKMPTCLNVKLKATDFSYLMDSIIFRLTATDFQDSICNFWSDGISVYMFTTFKNKELEETELYNYFTPNNRKLFNFILNRINEKTTDTITENYLKKVIRIFE